jgi:hypothetical protein
VKEILVVYEVLEIEPAIVARHSVRWSRSQKPRTVGNLWHRRYARISGSRSKLPFSTAREGSPSHSSSTVA